MPSEILRVGAEFDVGPLVAGAQQASTSIESLASKIKASGLTAEETASALVNLGFGEKEAAAAAAQATEAISVESAAQTETISTSSELSAAIAALTAEIHGLTIAKTAAAGAGRGMTSAMGAARVEMGLAEGSAGMMAGGLARVAAQSAILAPLIQAVFLPAAALAFADIVAVAAEKVYHLYQNVVLLKGSIDALDKSSASEAEKATALNYEYERGLAERLEAQKNFAGAEEAYRKAAADKPLELPKIDDKIYKQFSKDFVSFLQSVHTTADAPTVITRINAELESTQQQLDKAKEKLDNTIQMGGSNVVPAMVFERYKANVADLAQKFQFLSGIIGEVNSQTGIAANDEATRLAHNANAEDEAAKRKANEIVAYDDLRKKQLENQAATERIANEYATIARDTTIMFSGEEDKRQAKIGETTAKDIEEEQRRKEQSIGFVETAAMQDIETQQSASEQTAKIDELRVQGSLLSATTKAKMIGDIQIAELEQLKAFEAQKLAIELAAKQQELDLVLGGQSPDQFLAGADEAQLTQFAKIHGEMDAIKARSAAVQTGIDGKIAVVGQDTANKVQAAWVNAANAISSHYNTAFNAIMNGTMSVGRAFEQMGARIVNQTVLHLQDLVIKWGLHEAEMVIIHATANQAKVASDATAAVQTKTISSVTSLKEIEHSAAVAAAKTWTAVAGIPIIGPVLAPIAAAAAFAGVLGFEALATAQQGAVLPANQLVYAHQNEMILPAHLSQGIQSMIAAGGGGGGHTFHIGQIVANNPQDLMKQIRKEVRNGRFRI